MDKEVERVYKDSWQPIVENPDGTLNVEQVKKELCDFKMVMDEVSKVYCELTGGRISKVNTKAEAVIAAANDYIKRKSK